MKNPWRKNLNAPLYMYSRSFSGPPKSSQKRNILEKLVPCYEIKIEQNKMKLSDSSIDSSPKMICHLIRVDFPTKIKN